jgi:recombination protein RecA
MEDTLLSKLKKINNKREIISAAKDILIKERIPTGSLGLDSAIGGGWPSGRIITLWGAKASTKTTLSLYSIKNAQAMGKQCLFIDAENTFDASWAKILGVDVDNLLYMKEMDVDTIIEKAREEDFFKEIDVCVLDSISIIYSSQYLEDGSGAMGLNAKAAKKLINILAYLNPNALIIVISQITEHNIGILWVPSFTGGHALEHHASLIVKLSSARNDQIKEKINGIETIIGQGIRWKVEKSKISTPLLEGQYRFYYNDGIIDSRYELVELAIRKGIIVQTGSWLTYKDIKVQGPQNMVETLENVDIYGELKNEIFEKD